MGAPFGARCLVSCGVVMACFRFATSNCDHGSVYRPFKNSVGPPISSARPSANRISLSFHDSKDEYSTSASRRRRSGGTNVRFGHTNVADVKTTWITHRSIAQAALCTGKPPLVPGALGMASPFCMSGEQQYPWPRVHCISFCFFESLLFLAREYTSYHGFLHDLERDSPG